MKSAHAYDNGTVVVSGHFTFDARHLSAHEGHARVFVYLDGAYTDRVCHKGVCVPGKRYSYKISGSLMPKFNGKHPADARIVFAAQVQRPNEQGVLCYVYAGMESVDLLPLLGGDRRTSAGNGPLLIEQKAGTESKVAATLINLIMGPVQGRVKGVLRDVGISATSVPAPMGAKYGTQRGMPPQRLIYPPGVLDLEGSITTQSGLQRAMHLTDQYVDQMQDILARLQRTQRGTDGIRCFVYPGETRWATGLRGSVPVQAMFMRPIPVTTEAFWENQIDYALQRGIDTDPPGIRTRAEWEGATAERRSAFMALVVANTGQMLEYMPDQADNNEGPSLWSSSNVEPAEIFSNAASEGAGDCEDTALFIMLLKLSLEALVVRDPNSMLASIQRMSRTYIPFIALCSVNSADVASGMSGDRSAERPMGAHMTLLWIPGKLVERNLLAVKYATVPVPDVPHPEEGQQHVIITEGTGAFTTGLEHQDGPDNREGFLRALSGNRDELPIKRPLAERWKDPATGKFNVTRFFSMAQDLFGVCITEGGGDYSVALLSYSMVYRKSGDGPYTYGAPLEQMMNDMEGCRFLPHRAIPLELLRYMASGTRGSVPPPLMDAPTRPVEVPPALEQLRAAMRTGAGPKFGFDGAMLEDPAYELQNYWICHQALTQPQLAAELVQAASQMPRGVVSDMQYRQWGLTDDLPPVYRISCIVKKQ